MPDEASKKIDQALAAGLDIAAVGALFAYFLYETPEGKKLRQEINADWQKTVAQLHEDKLLKGKEMGLKEWLSAIDETLRKPREVTVTPVVKKRLRRRIDKSGRFRGV